MKNIDIEINRIEEVIKIQRARLSALDNTKVENQKNITILNEHITYLEQQIKQLQEKKYYQNNYSHIKPEYGDRRYRNFKHKNALDMLRVLYYDFFNREPSISLVENDYVMFGDPTLPIEVNTFLIRGEIPFKIMFTTNYTDYKPLEDFSLAIKFDSQIITKENYKKYLHFMTKLLKIYTNNEVNLICSDGRLKSYTLAYIGDKDFHHYSGSTNEKMYYDFFELLCDNLLRNIIYIGDTMKRNARLNEIEQVHSDFVTYHVKIITEILGTTTEELIKSNEELKNHVLKLSRSL